MSYGGDHIELPYARVSIQVFIWSGVNFTFAALPRYTVHDMCRPGPAWAVTATGGRLQAVRLDSQVTPASVREVRALLDATHRSDGILESNPVLATDGGLGESLGAALVGLKINYMNFVAVPITPATYSDTSEAVVADRTFMVMSKDTHESAA